MFRKLWNYLFGKKREPINLDGIAKDFVGQVFPSKSELEEDYDLVENLDRKHFDALDREVDPLEGVTKIPDNSVMENKAKIPLCNEVPRFLKSDVATEVVKPDRILKCNAKISTVDHTLPPRRRS